ncbi:carbon dioxide-concentrating mechanism protein CcmK [Microseira wollei]|uniref:Carboxysome shell protein CcmK n=1 Tax=Microseira wollei NIES-4236 TaxID=2530354 RepID=A0AAV3XE92_9CYAN|nr:carbon dioxide-concentrating mechanism protein CcmK [Microseira wollei]GET39778.1 carbon dioxide concentrating mechanism protein CcmK [Microseira wollei NIES-4236]
MTKAVGMVEVLGIPAVSAVADVMVKAARVTFVAYENIDIGYVTVIVRGDVAEVLSAVTAGIEAAKNIDSIESPLLSYHVIPRPHPNLDFVLPIGYVPAVEPFRV